MNKQNLHTHPAKLNTLSRFASTATLPVMTFNRSMKRTVLFISIVVSALLLVPAPLARAQQTSTPTSVDLLKGPSAFALFESYDATGCVGTDITLSAGNTVARIVGPGATTYYIAQTGIDISIFNLCDNNLVVVSSGATQTQTLTISPDLSSAHLVASAILSDQNGNQFTANIDVTWTAIALPVASASSEIDRFPGMIVKAHFLSIDRPAQAAGTISLTATASNPAMPNIIPVPSFAGSIGNVENGTITVSLPH